MLDLLRPAILRVLRVPPEPQAPAGGPGSLRVFRAARGFLWICLARWAGKQLATVAGLIFAVALLHGFPGEHIGPHNWQLGRWLPLVYLFEGFGFLLFLVQLPFTLLVTLLGYEQRWYLVTDRSLRIRSGIWTVDELTMTYANVQELTVHQGPLQRLLGISDLKVRSAGGGAVQQEGHTVRETHVGYFHGVDNAAEIRDLILAHQRGQQDAGLGDPDEGMSAVPAGVAGGALVGVAASPVPGAGDDCLAAARELLAEARALRVAVSTPGTADPRGSGTT